MRKGSRALADAKSRKTVSGRCARTILLFGLLAGGSLALSTSASHAAKKASTQQMQERITELERENEQLRNVIDLTRNEVPQIPANETNQLSEIQAPQAQRKTPDKALDYNKKIRELERDNKALEKKLSEMGQGLQKYGQIMAKSEQDLAQSRQENEALKAQNTQNNNSQQNLGRLAAENNSLQKKIEMLEAENAQAQARLQSANPERMNDIQNTLAELQAENRKLAQALAEMSTQALALEKNRGTDALAARDGAEAKTRLAALEQQYKALAEENEALKKGGKSKGSPELSTLKLQNESLRQTIQAQNEALLASDDAVKLNARLKQENADMKATLSARKSGEQESLETINALQAELQVLKRQAHESNVSTASLEGLKQTIETLRAENDRLLQTASSGMTGGKTGGAGDPGSKALQAKVQELEDRLEKERAVTTQYRTKIKEYQDHIALANDAGEQGESESGQQEKSIYAPEIRSLMLENQELRARLELLEGGGQKSRSADTPENRGRESTQDMPTTMELLEKEPETKNVKLIRQNHQTLPEMPPASNDFEREQEGAGPEIEVAPLHSVPVNSQSVTKNLKGSALPITEPIAPVARAIEKETTKQVQNEHQQEEDGAQAKESKKEKTTIGTNG